MSQQERAQEMQAGDQEGLQEQEQLAFTVRDCPVEFPHLGDRGQQA